MIGRISSLRWGIALAVIVLGAALVALAFGGRQGEVRAQEKKGREVPVEAATVTVGPLNDEITAVGSLLSNESIVVRPEIAGRVEAVGFEEGAAVKAGELLFRLDAALFRAELSQAEARMQLASKNFDRSTELGSRGVVSVRTRDQDQSELSVAKANVELARVRLNKTELRAPFAGIVGLRKVSVGSYVDAGRDLVNLEDIDPIKVEFRLPERFLPALWVGQPIEVSVDAFPDQKFEGEIYAIDPLVDPQVRAIAMRARVSNKDTILRPGLLARVRVIMERKSSAVTIPEQAIVPKGDQRFVIKVVDGKAAQAEVATGIRRNGMVEITRGLAEGDVVVTAGQPKLQPGSAVKVVEPRREG